MFRVDNRHRRTARINIEACFPQDDAHTRDARLNAYYRAFWGTVLLQPRLWTASRDALERHTRFHGLEHLRAARDAGRPVVLLITHTVGLDHGIIGLSLRHRMHGIYKPFENAVVDWLVLRARRKFGGQPVSRGNQFRAMIRLLESGDLLCYLSDEDFGAKGSVFAPFLGVSKATLAMLPRIVARVPDAVVLPMASYHDADDDGIDVHLWPPLERYPSGDPVADATTMNAAIGATVRARPEQFLWKLRIFRTSPDGKGSRYARIERGELEVRDLRAPTSPDR